MKAKRKSNVEVAKSGLTLWLAQYLDDITCGLLCKSSGVQKEVVQVLEEIRQNRVCIYVKEGCGYCKRGVEFFNKNASENRIFVKNGESLNHRFALKSILGLPSISFPVIFLDGTYVGGSDDVLGDSQRIIAAMRNDPPEEVPFEVTWSNFVKEKNKFKLMMPPGGRQQSSRFMCCQTKVFSNVIRLWSLIHVLIFGLLLILFDTNANPIIGISILWILTYDIFMFVVHGSQPFSFLQTLCTIIIWKRRGNAVTTVPYKVVFAVYLNALVKILYDAHFVDLESMNSSTNRILLLSGIVNSSMLAVTRF